MVYVAGNGAPELMSHQILDTFALLDTQVTRLHAELQADRGSVGTAHSSRNQFSASHRALTRQLYPLMHHQLLPLIRQLGLQQVRLPHDIVHRPEPESTTTPSAPTMH